MRVRAWPGLLQHHGVARNSWRQRSLACSGETNWECVGAVKTALKSKTSRSTPGRTFLRGRGIPLSELMSREIFSSAKITAFWLPGPFGEEKLQPHDERVAACLLAV